VILVGFFALWLTDHLLFKHQIAFA
jgi:hypothetical protein